MWNVDLPKSQEGGLALFPPRSSKVLLGPPRSSCSWVREGIGLPLVPPGPPRPPPSGAPGLPSHGTAACRRPGPGATIHKKCGHHSTDSPPPPPQHQAREAPHTRPLFLQIFAMFVLFENTQVQLLVLFWRDSSNLLLIPSQ